MIVRDYLNHNRYPDDFNDILPDKKQGIKELHELGYVHRDLKPENFMINFCPLEVVVIDFNRALRQKIVTSAKVLGTPGYFLIREKQANDTVKRDIWDIGAIILESDMESVAQFGTKFEKQSVSQAYKHINSDNVCEEIKKIMEIIIIIAPSYPRQILDDILVPLKRARFQRYNKDKQIKFV